jgi:hypothetical protein
MSKTSFHVNWSYRLCRIIAALLALAATSAMASSIELSINVTTSSTQQHTTVQLEIHNSGNAPALDIRPILLLGKESLGFPKRQRLRSQHTYDEKVVISNLVESVAALYVDYKDSTGEQNTANTLVKFDSNEKDLSHMHIELPVLELTGDCATGKLLLNNLDPRSKKITLSLYVPRGIRGELIDQKLAMSARSVVVSNIQLCKQESINDGRYPYFVVLEENYQNITLSHIFAATVVLANPELLTTFFQNKKLVFTIIWICIAALFLSIGLSIHARRAM